MDNNKIINELKEMRAQGLAQADKATRLINQLEAEDNTSVSGSRKGLSQEQRNKIASDFRKSLYK